MMRVTSFVSNKLAAVALTALLALSACGGGAPTTVNPSTAGPVAAAAYNGPSPATADIQAFKISVWDNLQGDDRCGACHKPTQTPRFVRADDINLAYQEANTVVDLANPGLSRMVAKVRGGHHCWLADNNACGDTLTKWISDWASVTQGGAGKQIQLIAPTVKDAGASLSFPPSTSPTSSTVEQAFNSDVYTPILSKFCSRCHQASSATPQQPYFASMPPSTGATAADIQNALDTAYAAAQTKINLDDPSQSRFVLRLRNEFHNCWAPNGGAVDCAASAQAMEDAIKKMIADANITATPIDSTLVLSKALAMYDGTVASGGTRYDNNAIAVYEFKTGTGSVAYDTSGVQPALDLNLSATAKGTYTWVGGWGIQMAGGKAQGLTSASKKLSDLVGSTGEYSIEAWIAPANVTQTEARIVSYSGGVTTRNFELGQTVYNYDFFNHTAASNANGAPALSTPDAAKVLQASLQHVVVTYDPVGGRRIYVNGAFTGTADASGSPLAGWDDTFAFVLGNEVSGDKPWLGQIKFVAIHNRALTLPQIQQNFAAGVGERYFLLFSVSNLISVPQSYIMFEVSQYDSYSYLFKDPKFISLDPNAKPGDLVLKGMRIGINGAEATVGQAYSNVDTVLTDALYSSVGGESISKVGTIIGLQKGPTSDEFFLTFDQLGTQTHVHTEPSAPTPATPVDPTTQPVDIGVRTFDAINATMAKITGVDINNANIVATYKNVKQSLPATPQLDGFLDSHQSAVSQLAIAYCSELVNSSTLSNAFFGTSSFDVSTQPGRDLVINAVVNHVSNSGVSTQPDPAAVDAASMHGLLYSLIANTDLSKAALGLCQSAPCTGARVATVVTAVCATGLASANMLIQ